MREPHNAVLIVRAAADHRHVPVGRAERILDHRAEHRVADVRLLPERAVNLLDRVRDLGVSGIGQRLLRAGELSKLHPAVKSLGVPIGERVLKDRRVALLAAGLAYVGAGLVFQGIVAAV